MYSTPPVSGGIIAIGEAPGDNEDRQGEGFCGIAGKTLDRLLSYHEITREDYGRANICRCRPPENRKPRRAEIDACLPYLKEFLQQHKASVILAVGGTPANVFYSSGTLTSIIAHAKHRRYVPEVDWAGGALVVPMPHTSPLAWNRRMPNGDQWRKAGLEQVQEAVRLYKRANKKA